MSETIYNHKDSILSPWIVKNRRKNPQTDNWENDDLTDVTAVTATMKDAKTGVAVFTDQAAYVYDLVNALLGYSQVAGDVATVGYYVLTFTLTRGGKAQVLPSNETNQVYVRIWE